jgi:AraC family transcriptional regulator
MVGQSKLTMRADPAQTAGSRLRSRDVAGFVIADARYHAHAETALHTHASAGLAYIFAGRYAKRIGRVERDCGPGTVTFEPPGVEHAERYGHDDVRALLIELSPARFEMVSQIVPAPVCLEHARAAALAGRLRRELRASDTASALAIEGLALELVANIGRAIEGVPSAPSWLGLIVSRLRDECRVHLTVSDLAASAGVHPAHVARVFRARIGCSVGEFQRRLRVEWAMIQLQQSESSLDVIAQEAGFFDQSHFCRVFGRHVGISPGQFRQFRKLESDGPVSGQEHTTLTGTG